jgi:heme/copper-type cytochrome/quinol oxidase subunit 4
MEAKLIDLVNDCISIICIGVVGYILFQCVYFMFFGNEKNTSQRILFGYFLLLLFRILNTVLIARWTA